LSDRELFVTTRKRKKKRKKEKHKSRIKRFLCVTNRCIWSHLLKLGRFAVWQAWQIQVANTGRGRASVVVVTLEIIMPRPLVRADLNSSWQTAVVGSEAKWLLGSSFDIWPSVRYGPTIWYVGHSVRVQDAVRWIVPLGPLEGQHCARGRIPLPLGLVPGDPCVATLCASQTIGN